MIYASLKPIRQWHTRWTPANYILLGHWSGALLLAALACAYAARAGAFLALAAPLGVAALAAKLAYWQAIGAAAAAPTLERAIGVAEGVRGPGPVSVAHARLLDVGHSHGTFLTARIRLRPGAAPCPAGCASRRSRSASALPLAWLASGIAQWPAALAAAACCIIGLLIERWLFFAEARHTVRLYHGDPRT